MTLSPNPRDSVRVGVWLDTKAKTEINPQELGAGLDGVRNGIPRLIEGIRTDTALMAKDSQVVMPSGFMNRESYSLMSSHQHARDLATPCKISGLCRPTSATGIRPFSHLDLRNPCRSILISEIPETCTTPPPTINPSITRRIRRIGKSRTLLE